MFCFVQCIKRQNKVSNLTVNKQLDEMGEGVEVGGAAI